VGKLSFSCSEDCYIGKMKIPLQIPGKMKRIGQAELALHAECMRGVTSPLNTTCHMLIGGQ